MDITRLDKREYIWGIEVDVLFVDKEKGINRVKNFIFKNEKVYQADYAVRMVTTSERLVKKAETEPAKPEHDIAQDIERHFKDNTALTKEDYESFKGVEASG